MSVLIKGMKMPPSGDCLKLTIHCNGQVVIDRGTYWDEAEAVELPPHGDLIERDFLLAEYERDERAADEHGREFSFSFDSGGARCTEWSIVQQKLMDAPVVIPADKEGST